MTAADTIVALATPPGAGERAVLRLSGSDAWGVLARVLVELPPLRADRLLAARFPLGDGLALPVELLLWRGPRSSTGEDVAELHLRAWPPVVAELLRALVDAGCRPARRGEFTRRAVLLGKLDLARAEALGALGAATAESEARAALVDLVDGPRAELDALREELLGTLALLEAHVDHEEEDTEALADGALPAALAALAERVAALGDAGAARAVRDGELEIALLGPPNAGKSSLLLALCPDAVTTPSPVPGTTRDALHARRRHAGRELLLVDGPGVCWERPFADPLDALAMQHHLAQLSPLAVIVDVEDAAAPTAPAERARRRAAAGDRPVLAVANKADLLAGAPPAALADRLLVSAVDGRGLPALLDAAVALAPPPAPLGARLALQRALLADLAPLLHESLATDPLGGGLPLLALALREALERLDAHAQRAGGLTEELLDRVFAGFCLGK